VGVVEVPRDRAREFGVLTVDESNRVLRFQEKPMDPEPIPGRPDVTLASMGIYVFNPKLLERLLRADAEDPNSAHDFGRNIIPGAIDNLRVFAYPFEDVRTKAQNYWRDVGTVDAYYEANMELVRVSPELNIYDEQWPIWTYQEQLPPAKFVFDDIDRRGTALDSMVSGGCIISGHASPIRCCSPTCACTTTRRSIARSSCRECASASTAPSATRSSTPVRWCQMACRSASIALPTPSVSS